MRRLRTILLGYDFTYPSVGSASCKANNSSLRLVPDSDVRLDWWFVHMAMRTARISAAHGLPHLEDLRRHANVTTATGWLYEPDARIVEGHFLVKVEGIARLNYEDLLWDDAMRWAPRCAHAAVSKMDNVVRAVCIRMRRPRLRSMESPLLRCHDCPSETKITVIRESHAGRPCVTSIARSPGVLRPALYTIFVTRWADAGQGASLDDPFWTKLTQGQGLARSSAGSGTRSLPFDLGRLGSIRKRFEGDLRSEEDDFAEGF